MGKLFTLAEISEHNNKKDCWLLINGKVYDVTKFLDDHPGGDDVLLTATGKDATDDFEDVGHSSSARSMMDEFLVGEIDSSTIPGKSQNTPPPKQTQAVQDKSSDFLVKLLQFLVPLLILGLAFGVRFYTKSSA
ncbi:cytochrome b5-like [Primulina tabacum]|uniref:cytochrome b5-like n=1 Tax=Primulina tabacum TaxID=48773 RepID=UPI003F59C7F6